MDILKELFGTSDELQISKSLFGSDASSTPVDLGLDHPGPLPSPSRDCLPGRPLPLLPVEPRPQNTSITSSLVRSHSLDNLHGSAGKNVDNILRPDPLRAQSVFPKLSETGTTNHVHLPNVPHEMPMYLLEEDEGNDEEIKRLLETTADSTPNHSGRTSVVSDSNHSGRASVVSDSNHSGSVVSDSNRSGRASVVSDSYHSGRASSPLCIDNSWRTAEAPVVMDTAIETVAMEVVAMETEEIADKEFVDMKTASSSPDVGPSLEHNGMETLEWDSETSSSDLPLAVSEVEVASTNSPSSLVIVSSPSPLPCRVSTLTAATPPPSNSPSPLLLVSAPSPPPPTSISGSPSPLSPPCTDTCAQTPDFVAMPTAASSVVMPTNTPPTILVIAGCHAYQGRRHSVSPQRQMNRPLPSLPASLPLSPVGNSSCTPILPLSSKCTPKSMESTPLLSPHTPVTSPIIRVQSTPVSSPHTPVTSPIIPVQSTPVTTPVLSPHTPVTSPIISVQSTPATTPVSSPHTPVTSPVHTPTLVVPHITPAPRQNSPSLAPIVTPTPTPTSTPDVPPIAPPLTPPLAPTLMQHNIRRLKEQVRLQAQRIEKALKSVLPQPTTAELSSGQAVDRSSGQAVDHSSGPNSNSVLITTHSTSTTADSVTMPTILSSSAMTSVPSFLKATVPGNGIKTSTTSSPTVVATYSVAIQAGNGLPNGHSVAMETNPMTHDDKTCVDECRNNLPASRNTNNKYVIDRGDDVMCHSKVTVQPEHMATSNNDNLASMTSHDESHDGCSNDDVTLATDQPGKSDTEMHATMATSTSVTETMATSSHSLKLIPSSMSPFHSTFSVCVPSMNWRVGPLLGMKALPITILPPPTSSPLTPSLITPSSVGVASQLSSKELLTKKKKRRNGGGWPKGKKRKVVRNDLPKPPSTAYGLFLSDQRETVGKGITSMPQLSKIVGKLWSKLPAHAKQEYDVRAVEDRKRYLRDLRSYLTKIQREGASCDLVSVDALLDQLVTTAEDNSLLYCQLCQLSFRSLHNKQSHFCSRLHADSLLSELHRLMGEPRNETRSSPHSKHGMDCGLSSGMDPDPSVSMGKVEVNGVSPDARGLRTGLDNCHHVITDSYTAIACDSGQKVTGEGHNEFVTDGCITIEDKCNKDGPSPDNDCTVHGEECDNGAVPFANSPVPNDDANLSCDVIKGDPHSEPHEDSVLVEWAQDYAGVLERLKQHALATKPRLAVETRQTSILNEFQEQEQGLLEHVDTLLNLLNSLSRV